MPDINQLAASGTPNPMKDMLDWLNTIPNKGYAPLSPMSTGYDLIGRDLLRKKKKPTPEDFMVPIPQTIQEDYRNPTRFIDYADIPDMPANISDQISNAIKGHNMPWHPPNVLGVYSDLEPVTVTGFNDNRMTALSAATMAALLQRKRQTYVQADPELAKMAELNPNFDTDPTYTPRNTAIHELVHGFLKQFPVQTQPEEYERPAAAVRSGDPIPEWALKSDQQRVQDIQNSFKSPFFNSHSHESINSQAAPIIAHWLEANMLGVQP